MKLSVALATFNEEDNIGECLESIKDIADEIIVVDGSSTDSTVELAERYGAQVIVTDNPPIFHINKQKAIDLCQGEWILQLDADERVTAVLAEEIMQVISMSNDDIQLYQESLPNRELFLRHQRLVEREKTVGEKEGSYAAFYIARRNYFLGKYLRYGGVYPDGVIRLIRKGKAYLPCKDVHELMVVAGKVGWLKSDLLHKDSPTFKRYLERNNRYINLMVKEFKEQQLPINFENFINYCVVKPFEWFFLTQLRHKGILDGYQGIVFSFFSALRFPRSYLRYVKNK
jgi:glycosyltransferase involved in cell wall biosynthesis